jgi:hypothetical protein
MIFITKMVEADLVDKLDLESLKNVLPSIEENISITLVATKRKRKPDSWEKEGWKYYRIILDYNKVVSSTKEMVLEMMKTKTIETISS